MLLAHCRPGHTGAYPGLPGCLDSRYRGGAAHAPPVRDPRRPAPRHDAGVGGARRARALGGRRSSWLDRSSSRWRSGPSSSRRWSATSRRSTATGRTSISCAGAACRRPSTSSWSSLAAAALPLGFAIATPWAIAKRGHARAPGHGRRRGRPRGRVRGLRPKARGERIVRAVPRRLRRRRRSAAARSVEASC